MQIYSRQRHNINRVINHVRSHVDHPTSLASLADIACISKYHFVSVFHDHCGETPFEFLSRVRLEHAIDNLVYKPDQPITEVALNSGYSNPQAFSRAFRQRYTISPRSYRQANSWRFDQFPQNQMEMEFKNLNLELPKLYLTHNAVGIRHIADTRLAYIRHIGLYDDADYRHKINSSYNKLIHWAKQKGVWTEDINLIGIVPNHPAITPAKYCTFDVAVTVCENFKEDDLVSMQHISASSCAVLQLSATHGAVHTAWDWLISEWLPNSGLVREQRIPCFQRFTRGYSSCVSANIEIELWMPVVKASNANLL